MAEVWLFCDAVLNILKFCYGTVGVNRAELCRMYLRRNRLPVNARKDNITEILTKIVAVLCHCQSLGVSTIELLLWGWDFPA